MEHRDIQSLLVAQEKSAEKLGQIARRGVETLAVLMPILAEVGRRLADNHRLMHAERRILAEKVASALDQAIWIIDGKAPADDDG